MAVRLIFDPEDATRAILKFEREVGDMTDAMRAIAGYLHSVTETAFAAERDPWTHEKWADLKRGTKRARARKGKWPGKKLQVTGVLAASHQFGWDSNTAYIGSPLDYAEWLNTGTPRMPARPIVGLHDTDMREIERIVNRKLFAK